jgi:deoxyribonuclease-4
MFFGIHVPRQRSLKATAEYARDIGCTAFQIFSGNPVGWAIGRLDPDDRDAFKEAVRTAGINTVLVHAPYLINMATPDRHLQARSTRALVEALTRAHELAAGPLVVHAGNHKGAGSDAGVARAIRILERALASSPGDAVLAIEMGAGKGTEIGVTFGELTAMVEPFAPDRVGVLLDTAHLWALGYDLRDPETIGSILRELDEGPGLNRLLGIHGNDSAAELGSRRDKHALWTEGRMGRRALRNLVRAPELSELPFVFEIPGDAPEFDRTRLASMKRMERRIRANAARAEF